MKTVSDYYKDLKIASGKFSSFWIGHYIKNDLSRYIPSGGEKPEDLHFTLAYCGDLNQYSQEQIEMFRKFFQEFCRNTNPMPGSISGIGRFSATKSSDLKDVIYASVDIPGLEDYRQKLCEGLKLCGISLAKDHGYTPHITLAYIEPNLPTPIHRMGIEPILFDSATLDCSEKESFGFGRDFNRIF